MKITEKKDPREQSVQENQDSKGIKDINPADTQGTDYGTRDDWEGK